MFKAQVEQSAAGELFHCQVHIFSTQVCRTRTQSNLGAAFTVGYMSSNTTRLSRKIH